MAISLDRLMGFHQKAAQIRQNKMEVIAGNIANANTPGYKAKDIDFKKAMAAANVSRSHELTRTHQNHIQGRSQRMGEIEFRNVMQPDTGDGNSVDMQMERNAFLDNGMRFQAGLQFLNGKIKGMKKAIKGGQGA